MAAAITPGRLPKRAVTAQYSSAEARKPRMYPPVVPSSTPGPPRKPENTGRPARPSSRYAATAYVPRRPPRTPRAANTPKVCRVKGTVRGTVIQAHTASSTVNRAV